MLHILEEEVTSSVSNSTPSLLSMQSSPVSPASTPQTPESGASTPPSSNDHGFLPHGFWHPSNSQTILVIGGLGFIGSHTSLELLKAGYNVVIVDNLTNSHADVVSRISTLAETYCRQAGRVTPTLNFHKLDYRSRGMKYLLESYSEIVPSATCHGASPSNPRAPVLEYRSRIHGVIHFAAHKAVAESIQNPLAYYENNVSGLIGLLSLLARHNIHRFVFSSSATVYGSKMDDGLPLREEDLVHHPEEYVDAQGKLVEAVPAISGLTSPYARTKYFAEAILADLAMADARWRIVALRYFNPIGCDESGLLGEDPRNAPTNLFPVITQVLTGERPELDIFGSDWDTRDGTAIRDFIHVSDVARGHVAALDARSDNPFRTYNLGSGTGTTVLEAVKSLEATSQQAIRVRWAGRRAGDVGFCVASRDRAVAELGWEPKESIEKCATDLWHYVSSSRTTTTRESDTVSN